MAKCDENILRFEELLTQMRTDLYSLIETLSGKISKIASNMDLSKRGIPRIISDVQLVLPHIIIARKG